MRGLVRHVLLILLTIGTMAAAAPNFIGTWKLDTAKSQMDQRRDGPEQTITIKQTGPDTYTTIIDSVSKSGQKRHQEIVRICDGREHPSPQPGAAKGAVSTCQVESASRRKLVEKDNGSLVFEMTSSVSGDGKVMTNLFKYNDGSKEVLVYERQ